MVYKHTQICGLYLPEQVGPAGIGAVVIGTRTMSESGTVGDFTREQIELFSLSELVTCMLEAEGEYISMDSTFSSGTLPVAVIFSDVQAYPASVPLPLLCFVVNLSHHRCCHGKFCFTRAQANAMRRGRASCAGLLHTVNQP